MMATEEVVTTAKRGPVSFLGIEALCAAQAIDLLAPLQPGAGTKRGYDVVRRIALRLDRDCHLASEIEAAGRAVAAGRFSVAVPAGEED